MHGESGTPLLVTPGYTLLRNASLKNHNSFRVEASADLLALVRNASALRELFGSWTAQNTPIFILGEGSNVLFTRDWPGLIVSIATRGIRFITDDGETALIRAEAGENWHKLVNWTIAQNLRGLENLSLIPGSVGAAPVQNIGAYGVELSECLHTVEAYDRVQNTLVRLTPSDCRFTYRGSVFKAEPHRFIICAVEFRLSRSTPFKLDYAGVRDELNAHDVATPNIADVAAAIIRLRQRKLPDPLQIGNAGSFFKNPMVASKTAETLKREYLSLPVYPAANGRTKLSAAWLIEQCGWKGFRLDDAGVSAQHALVLVNYGQTSGVAVLTLAQRIQASVHEKFGIGLEVEPTVI